MVSDEIPIVISEDGSDELPLNNEILDLLGADHSQKVVYGENLHKDVASRWNHILLNGLPKEEKTDILKLYLPAENCLFMKAPKINAEIKSAIPEAVYKKDAYNESKQNQMASCLSALGKALNLALHQGNTIPQEIIKHLSDAGRILCDTHYRESLTRRFNIINSLSKQKRDVIKNTKIDEHLFGADLCNHLKSSKEISKSAAELRPYKYNNNQASTSSARRPPTSLNARGWPRAPVAAAEQRAYPQPSATARRPPPPPPPAARAYRRDAQPPPPPPRPQQQRYHRPPAQRR